MKWKVKINGTFFIIIIFTVVALSLYAFLFSSNQHYSKIYEVEDGLLEITQKDLNYNITLSGKWRYYENQFHQTSETLPEEYVLVNVPHTFQNPGYGTYAFTLNGLTPGKCYSLYIYDTNSAYALYVDNQVIAENGKIGKNIEEEVVDFKTQVVRFTPINSQVQLLMNISSHHLSPGGFFKPIEFGTFENILREHQSNIASQMILFGSLLILGVYNLSLFLLNSEERSGLYFAIFTFFTAFRVPFIGERMINVWIEQANWLVFIRLIFLSSSVMFAAMIIFMYNLFTDQFNRKLYIGFMGAISLFTGLVLIFPLNWLSSLDMFFLGLAITYFVYLLFVIIKSVRKGIQGSVFSFIGIAFILGTIFIDATLPAGSNALSIGILIFLIFHSLVIAEKYAHIIEQNKLLHHVATRDGMTNFFKKEHFNNLVEGIMNENDSLMHHSIMFVDIDNFKHVNDTYGHDIGDEVIITISERILRSLRYSDIASRYGGDEFVLWLQNTKLNDASEIASRILLNVAEPIVIDDQIIDVSVSIGIALYPEDGLDLSDLLKICDKRMYLAKSKGKNQFIIE